MSICSQFYLVYSIFFAISCVKTNKLPFCQIISIYALLAEGDLLEGYGNDNPGAFQSTPSSRRATVSLIDSASPSIDFNPRPPHGGRLCFIMQFDIPIHISIHALLTEGDITPNPVEANTSLFQSTPSSRRATDTPADLQNLTFISIHALLTEGDYQNIRGVFTLPQFQSTPSSRRATAKMTNLSFLTLHFCPKHISF